MGFIIYFALGICIASLVLALDKKFRQKAYETTSKQTLAYGKTVLIANWFIMIIIWPVILLGVIFRTIKKHSK